MNAVSVGKIRTTWGPSPTLLSMMSLVSKLRSLAQ